MLNALTFAIAAVALGMQFLRPCDVGPVKTRAFLTEPPPTY